MKNNLKEALLPVKEEDKKQRFIQLSWIILEHKYRYYILDKPIIQDYDYDKLEKEYEALADELKLEPSASNMVGFDLDRPSCQSVVKKLNTKKKKRRKK